MKKAKILMFSVGCLNLLEIILDAIIYIYPDGFLGRQINAINASSSWFNIGLIYITFSSLVLQGVGHWSAVYVFLKSPRKDRYRYIAVAMTLLSPTRRFLHRLAMKQFIWIP